MDEPHVEPLVASGPPLPSRAIIAQHWGDLAFLHWRVDPQIVAPLLPAGTRPDVFDGATWVGLIAFEMSRSAFPPLPAIPYLGRFAETNVRLYSVDDEGHRGVVFRSLEASRLIPVLAARVGLGLPYMWARATVERDGRRLRYESRRRWPGGRGRPRSLIEVEPLEGSVEGDGLAEFLSARWGMHVGRGGRTTYWRNTHAEWPLQRAELVRLDDELVAAAGLPGIVERPPDSVLYSRGVDTRFSGPVGVASGARRALR